MMKIVMSNKLHFAPLDKPETILDIGTGTGIWSIEIGDEFPDANVIGTDLSPTQPTWYACSFPETMTRGSPIDFKTCILIMML